MSDKIWKAVLAIADTQEVEVPDGAVFLCAREQGDDVCIWFRCDPTNPKRARTILMRGTGHDAPGRLNTYYVGTAVMLGGALVWHVFAVGG